MKNAEPSEPLNVAIEKGNQGIIMQQQKNILLCVAGLTPQIILETLYVLTVEKEECVDEIRVITTLDGRDKIMTGIVDGRGSAEESLLHPEEGKFYAFCRDYPEQTQGIRFDESCLYILNKKKTGIPSSADWDEDRLPDIRTAEDNQRAANQICEIVRELTAKPHIRLHASAAGGRKTMSVYLTAAMQLFGRVEDRLSHVLVNPPFENNHQFYYKPPQELTLSDNSGKALSVTTKAAQIDLAPIPFVRLRRIITEQLQGELGDYNDLVTQAQDELDLVQTEHDLRLELKNECLKVATRIINLPPRDFLLYTIFALRRQRAANEEEATLTYEELRFEHFQEAICLITQAQDNELDLSLLAEQSNLLDGTPYAFLQDYLRFGKAGIELDATSLTKSLREAVTRINIEMDAARLPERYMIKARSKTGRVSHNWLAVSPKQIILAACFG
jgi:CRISPR-associated protein (TIGR02584 family)